MIYCKRNLEGKLIAPGFIKKEKTIIINNPWREYEKDARKIKGLYSREKKLALRCAYDLYYDDKCKDEIINASSLKELDKAMINGRIRQG